MPLDPGSRLGCYEVLSAIGAGGMGEVYRARDTKLNREVAIKVLLDAVATDPDRTARFSREAQALASLNHPNIGAIYGIEDSGGVRALVMELVEGPTLAERLEGLRAQGSPLRASGASAGQAGLPLDEALAIAKQIADALEAAHEKGVIHRDLKPANVKVTADGTVKVLDFGLAKMLETGGPVGSRGPGGLTMSPTLSVQATYAGVILGTAAYMSPEQARGRAVDRRTDVWAFGCVIFEMLAGVRPFDGDDVIEMIGAVVHKEPAWERLPSATPAIVRTTLQRCLEKDPKKRIRDAGARDQRGACSHFRRPHAGVRRCGPRCRNDADGRRRLDIPACAGGEGAGHAIQSAASRRSAVHGHVARTARVVSGRVHSRVRGQSATLSARSVGAGRTGGDRHQPRQQCSASGLLAGRSIAGVLLRSRPNVEAHWPQRRCSRNDLPG
jgi:serine/threonine protein kinase